MTSRRRRPVGLAHALRSDRRECLSGARWPTRPSAPGLSSWGLSDHVRADTDLASGVRRGGPGDPARRPADPLRGRGEAARHGGPSGPARATCRGSTTSSSRTISSPVRMDRSIPRRIRTAIERGTMTAADAVSDLVAATICGVRRSPYLPILAHLFSLLPKMGLSEADVTDAHLRSMASACLHAGGVVEVNEKWRCPSARTVAYLVRAGVPIIAGQRRAPRRGRRSPGLLRRRHGRRRPGPRPAASHEHVGRA